MVVVWGWLVYVVVFPYFGFNSVGIRGSLLHVVGWGGCIVYFGCLLLCVDTVWFEIVFCYWFGLRVFPGCLICIGCWLYGVLMWAVC